MELEQLSSIRAAGNSEKSDMTVATIERQDADRQIILSDSIIPLT
jgi:hypothetical protein